MRAVVVMLALSSSLAIGACGPVPAKDVGKQLFAEPKLSPSDVNAFSCSTCHAMGDAGDAIKPGFDLKNAARRQTFWGGYSTSLLDATNDCLKFFMRGEPLQKDDPKARALYEYLASTASKDEDAKPLSIVENVTHLARGNPDKGSKVWDRACRECHGDPHTGNGRISDQAVAVPEDSIEFAKQIGFDPDLVVIEKVRHGAFFGVGGTMPPFSREQLSDDDLGALIAFLGL
jgi:thiosulfate dehydrogenase